MFVLCNQQIYSKLVCFQRCEVFNSLWNFCSFLNSIFGDCIFCADGPRSPNSFVGLFCFRFFCVYRSIKQVSKNWITFWTNRNFIASFSSFARSLHWIFFLRLTNSLISLKLRFASFYFVYENIKWETFLIFHPSILLNFTKVRRAHQNQILLCLTYAASSFFRLDFDWVQAPL